MAKKSFSGNMPAEMFISQETQSAAGSAPAGYKVNHELVETKSRRVQLLMQPTLHSRLKEQAEQQGLSFNDYVHKILEKAVEGK